MFRSIWLRIAIPVALLILIIILGMGIYLSNILRAQYLQSLESQMASQAYLISEIFAEKLASNPQIPRLDELTAELAEMASARLTIIATDGAVIGESSEDSSVMENHLNRPEVISALSTGYGSDTRFSRTSGVNTFYVSVRFPRSGETMGVVRLARPLVDIETDIAELQRVIMAVSLVAATIAIIILMVIVNKTTQPIRQLTETAMKFAQSEQLDRLESAEDDEGRQLVQALNILAMRVNSQASLAEVERNKLAAVLKEMTDGVVIIDAEGCISIVNQAAAKMFSITRERMLGKTVAEGFRQHVLVDLWTRCVETRSSQITLLEIPLNRLYLQCIATPLGDTMPGYTMLLFQNLTQQRFLENVRRDFISNLSHELRTPLASLKALTETLQEGALEDPPAAHRFLQRMDAEVDALSQMVSELLELARIESGRVPLNMQEVSPSLVVNNAVERLRLQAERANLEIILECADDLPEILADPPRLEQVIVNLLHNAIKFTPTGGTIFLTARQEDTSVLPYASQEEEDTPAKDVLLFSVRDTGIGIQSDDLPRIFERFYKADRARSSGGTGLGLAIARHTVEAHGGKIWAESEEGLGSTFYFYIPLA